MTIVKVARGGAAFFVGIIRGGGETGSGDAVIRENKIMTRASGIQLHGGWAVMLSLALTTFPSHADTLSYGYDANGNRISGDGQYYEYNDANRLVRVRQGNASGPILAEFFYDHTGQRIKKIENGVTTYYIGKHFEANQQGYGTVNTNYYFAGTERVAKKENTGPLSFYHANHLGSTEAISDANGNLVNRTKYFPFGEIRQGGAEKYSFTGKERDAVSGQYYFEARYYASPFKHFTQADTVVPSLYDPQSLNRYSYVVNNPVTNIDPTGHEWWKPWTWNLYKQQAKERLQYVTQKGKERLQYVTQKGKEITKNILGIAKLSSEKATSTPNNINIKEDRWLGEKLSELWLKDLPIQAATDYGVYGLEKMGSYVGSAVVGITTNITGIVTSILAEAPEILENWQPVLKDIQNQKKGGQLEKSGGGTWAGSTWRYSQCGGNEQCMFGP